MSSDVRPCAWAALSATLDAAGVIGALVDRGVWATWRSDDVESLAASIGDRQLVLVLDNCEQVIAACADVVLRLLQRVSWCECPGDQSRAARGAGRGRLPCTSPQYRS